MLFNSIEYLFFLPVVFAIYWSLNKHLNVQNLFLLAASYLFYGLWDYKFLSLIIISSLADYLIGLELAKQEAKKTRKLLLGASLLVNLGFLLAFKYFNFFVDSFADFISLFGFQPNIKTLAIILPVGISFYTFQTLSYTIDVYRKKMKPTESMLHFFTYVAFFPQLVAGPIERASRLLPQIESKRTFDYTQGVDGLRQILWGLFKKVVVADNCAVFVDTVFGHYDELSGPILFLGALFFSIQIYCDFSGYSDIAIGTAKLLGINLMQNFATPYFARDIAEFWRRWHISLSTWFRDYLYIPLGGSRNGKKTQLRNIFAIFLVSGFWHGANWTFIVWGLIHALCYIPQVFTQTNRKYLDVVAEGKWLPKFSDFLRIIRTFIIVTIAWIFFRSDSVTDSCRYISRMFNSDHRTFVQVLGDLNLSLNNLQLVTLFILIAVIFEWMNRAYEHGLQSLPKIKLLRYIIYIILCLLVIEYFYGEKTFIYFQF